MTEQLQMEVTSRDERGKNAARRLRVAGSVPATLYGMQQDPVSLAINTKAMTALLSHREHRNRVLNLTGAAAGTAMAIDWQVDPVHGVLLHVDLKRVDVNVEVEAKVALVTTGVAYGVKTEGGMEDVVLREVMVRCLPADLPETIVIDVTHLKAGESIRLGDLETDAKYKTLGNPSAVVVRIVGKRTEDEAEEGEEAAVAAPAVEAVEE